MNRTGFTATGMTQLCRPAIRRRIVIVLVCASGWAFGLWERVQLKELSDFFQQLYHEAEQHPVPRQECS
jgi:hypothetical protein